MHSMQCFIKHHIACLRLFIMEAKIPKFEADVVDLLLCSVVQDRLRTKELETRIEDVFDQISIDQLSDTIQILFKCHKVLEATKRRKMI